MNHIPYYFMTPSHDLHQLIKAMTPSEKRYFRLVSFPHSAAKESNLLRLFLAIDKQETYEESAIKKIFSGQPFMRQLPVAKNNLMKLLLRSLRAFHAEKSVNPALRELLDYAGVLTEKGLYTMASRVLDRAEKLALRFEKFEMYNEVLRCRESLLHKDLGHGKSRDDIEHIGRKKEENIQKLINLNQYRTAYFKSVLPLRETGNFSGPGEKLILRKLVKGRLLNNEQHALSLEAKFYHYYIHSLYAIYQQKKMPEAYRIATRYIAMLESQPDIVRESPMLYLDTLYLYADLCVAVKGDQADEKVIRKIQRVNALSVDLQAARFERLYTLLTDRFLRQGSCKQLQKLEFEIEKGLSVFGEKITPLFRSFLRLNTASLLLAGGYPAKAKKWTAPLLQEKHTVLREDMHAHVLLLNILIQYELGDTGALEHYLNAARYFLKKTHTTCRTFKAIIEFGHSALRLLPPKEAASHIKALCDKLRHCKESPERKLFLNFDYLVWAERMLKKNMEYMVYSNPQVRS